LGAVFASQDIPDIAFDLLRRDGEIANGIGPLAKHCPSGGRLLSLWQFAQESIENLEGVWRKLDGTETA